MTEVDFKYVSSALTLRARLMPLTGCGIASSLRHSTQQPFQVVAEGVQQSLKRSAEDLRAKRASSVLGRP